ncbi:MAG: hypothetical protein ACUZ8O_05935 [Candidatus Anammoxibacter sp.]
MNKYSDYTIALKLQSPIVTRFQSDTLFGHICWAIKYLKWDKQDKLAEFLGLFDEEQQPPLIISNGYPKDSLPKPVIPPVTQKELDGIVGKENRIEKSFIVKSIKNLETISKDKLKTLVKAKMTPAKLFEIIYRNYTDIDKLKRKEKTMVVQHNTVDRFDNKVKKGLYAQNEIFFDESGNEFEIYIVDPKN